jgi:hypothetical protein
MPFAIEMAGTLPHAVRTGLVDLVGDEALAEQGGRTVLWARDQSAMIGILHRLNDLGLHIDRIERT